MDRSLEEKLNEIIRRVSHLEVVTGTASGFKDWQSWGFRLLISGMMTIIIGGGVFFYNDFLEFREEMLTSNARVFVKQKFIEDLLQDHEHRVRELEIRPNER